ncbi:CAP domain-containing protein [Nocardioides sp. ChNu-153]|uniref:CAP domain-containing protein n=1 Tax=unclassified Nocardioides TaxID=2615069 RepID=UPI0024049F09|nr:MULTISPECIES: CAP domain-containing protein [unclassified Nocardioides]MDF9717721.1 CAP domain-containing protein [Nocardioides sp. ChNu-99]MDN7121812.1 CAP domain-containing protein [Nocardioides sp. ChNu-153]
MRKFLTGLVLSLSLVSGAFLVAPPPAVAAPTTTLAFVPATVAVGQQAKVEVRSSFVPVRGNFRLQELRGSSWVTAAELPSYQNYGFTIPAGSTVGTRTFRVAAKADSRTWVFSRNTTLTVARGTTALTTTTPQVRPGGTIGFEARSSFVPDAGSFRLQERRSGAWTDVAELPSYRNYGFTRPAGSTVGVRTFRTVATVGGTWVGSSWANVTVGDPAPPTDDLTEARNRIVADTNAARAEAGLRPLGQLAGAHDVAQGWAAQMARTGRFEHNPDYARQMPAGWTRVAENIAYGYGVTGVVDAWMDSPGHRANILGDFTHIGVGVATDANGRPYYVQNFGKY